MENLCPRENLHTNACSSCVHNRQNLEAIISFSGEWISKLGYLHTMEYYPALKINVLSSHEKTRKNLIMEHQISRFVQAQWKE